MEGSAGSAGRALTADAPVEQLFCELVAIPSPSGRERAVGEAIATWLAAAGVESAFDGAGAVNDSDAGNLIARLPGADGAPTLLFIAHMDTVESGSPAVIPVVGDDGIIRSGGPTILGADNKSAVAAAMRACAATAALDPATRPSVICAFTCREEAGRMGASVLDLDALGADLAFSVDGSQPIGTVITRALGQHVFTVEIRGRAAHAAADPGAGVSAIAVAGQCVSRMALGRLPGGGSASIAAIVGGGVVDRVDGRGLDAVRAALEATPTNSIPDLALMRGEVRGFTTEAITGARDDLEAVVSRVCEARGAEYSWFDRERAVPPFPGTSDSHALELARRACAQVDGVTFSAIEAHATLEANYLAAAVDVVALASGGRDPHQHSESVGVVELQRLEALLTAIVVGAAI